MSLGVLKCYVKNLHIGSLKKFGFNSAIMPEEVKEVTQEMLDDPLIKSALGAGVIEFIPKVGRGRPKKEETVELVEPPVEPVSETQIKPLKIISLITPDGFPVTPEEEESFRDQLIEAETNSTQKDEEVDVTEEFEALLDKVNNGKATESDIETLFNIINNMNGFDAQKAVKLINDNVSLLTMLAEKCKFAKVQTAAKKKLESIQQ